jgi:oxalate decarboxylase/phosphoglucose isomerase-like protein (cupin superfamily)
VFFSLHKVPQVPKCPNISVVVLKGCGGYMLLDDKTIFVKRDDDIMYVAKGVFHRVINPTGGERIFETISPGKV